MYCSYHLIVVELTMNFLLWYVLTLSRHRQTDRNYSSRASVTPARAAGTLKFSAGLLRGATPKSSDGLLRVQHHKLDRIS